MADFLNSIRKNKLGYLVFPLRVVTHLEFEVDRILNRMVIHVEILRQTLHVAMIYSGQ